MSKRLFFIRNDSGGTDRFFDQVLSNGEVWEIVDRKMPLWRDADDVQGLISSGTLSVGDGAQWFNPTDGEQYFYDEPQPTTLNWPFNSIFEVISGTNLFGGIQYDFEPKNFIGDGLIVTSGTDGITLEVDNPAVVGLGSTTISSGTNTITISGAPTYGLQMGPDGMLYTPDPTRGGKTLSVTRPMFTYGKSGQQKLSFLEIAGVGNAQAGVTLPRPATITAFTAHHLSGTMVLNLTASGSVGTFFLQSVPLAPGINESIALDIDLPDEANIQFYLANSNNVKDPIVTVELAWRLE